MERIRMLTRRLRALLAPRNPAPGKRAIDRDPLLHTGPRTPTE